MPHEQKLYSWENTINNNLIITEDKTEQIKKITLDTTDINTNSNNDFDNIIVTSSNLDCDDNLINIKKKIHKNMPSNLSVFSGKQRLIREANYTFLDKNGARKRGTRTSPSFFYMRPLLNNLRSLDQMLERTINLEDAESIQSKFRDVCISCENYLENRNPWTAEGKARKQMVKDFYAEVKSESLRFSERIDYMERNQDAEYTGTWISLLSDIRTEYYTDGEDGVKIKSVGNTTDVLCVKKGDKKVYFKENEKLPSIEDDDLWDMEIKRVGSPDKEDQTQANNLKIIYDALKSLSTFISIKNIHNMLDDPRTECKMINKLSEYFKENKNYKELELEKVVDAINLLDTLTQEYTTLYNEYKELRKSLKEANTDADKNSINEKIRQKNAEIKACNYYALANSVLRVAKNIRCASIAVNHAKINENSELSKRNVASARMAKLLGLNNDDSNQIAKSVMADVCINGEHKRGIVMEEVKGTHIYEITKNEKIKRIPRYTEAAFRELINLQIFDLIMGQVDRNNSNYLVQYTISKDDNYYDVSHITGIDNDTCCGNINYMDILKKGENGINRLKNIEFLGSPQIPVMEQELANKIKILTPEIIHHQFCDILDKSERKALIDRIQGVQDFLKRMEKLDKKKTAKFILSKTDTDEWKNRLNEYSTSIKTRIDSDEKAANDYKNRISDKFKEKILKQVPGPNEKPMTDEYINNTYKLIDKNAENLRNLTRNKILLTTYFNPEYLDIKPKKNLS